MKNKIQLFCTVLLALGYLSIHPDIAMAVIANPDPVSYTQPDGSKLTILIMGDEFIHWAVTSDGYTIMPNAKGAYEYGETDHLGKLVFSGIQANDPEKRNLSEWSWLDKISKGLFFSKSQVGEMKSLLEKGNNGDAPLLGGFPSTGTRKLLMILANFSNTAVTYNQASFNNYMNQVNYNGTGSFRDYYIEVSYGQLTVNTTVTVWVTLPNTHDYYGPDTKWGEFAYDAVVAANNQASVNFSEYDNNLDGIVDGISVIHQGQGQEETGNITDIWSHSWNLTSAGYTAAQRTFDGVQVNSYITMPEKNATGMGTIGVICHEFCHNLGSPDFYDTDYATGGSYTGTGKWDLMAGGSWNGVSGSKPAHPNAWIKTFLNWTAPVILSTVQNVTLRNAQAYPDVVRFNTQSANEYFLCENRQQTGFDAGIPGHGMIIYHIDGNFLYAQMSSNSINTSSHQGLYPVCANSTGNPTASYGTINGTGCPFPGTGTKSSFTDVSTPYAHSWANANSGFPLTGIFEYTPTGEVSFCFISCNTPADPTNFAATPSGISQVNLSWGLNTNSSPVLIACGTTPAFGTPADGSGYQAGSMIPGGGTVIYNGTNTSFPHTGLNASTTYYYKAWSILAGNTYSMGVTSRGTTFCGVISSFPWVEGFENSGMIPGCWTQEQVNNSGLNWNFPTGNGGTAPAVSHSGAYNACLKDKTAADTKTRLITPALDLTLTTNPQLTFWHTQPIWSTDQDQLSVYYKTSPGGSWTLLSSFAGSIPAWTQETISLPNGSATYYLAFEGNAKFGYGVCLDDVQIASSCAGYLPVSISITASMNPVLTGTVVTNSAVPCNGGTSPAYQWKVGGTTIAGATNASFSNIPANNDEITCVLTSNAACVINNPAISNSVIMSVSNFPAVNILQNLGITGTQCFDAIQTITVAGNGTTFIVENGGNATMIAGEKISYLPGTLVRSGGYMKGSITETGQYCSGQAPSIAGADGGQGTGDGPEQPFIKAYPNPTDGLFTVELNGMDDYDHVRAEVSSITGRKVFSKNLSGGRIYKFSLGDEPAGIYLFRVVSGKNTGTFKIIRR
ncbi:MAG: M6 family metalloprotease domain-containing protein [Bacteroidetes bacterium]|nr:M6 family metalloprotease domain-containing protein [Bacteroidota bacterium]